MSQFESIDKVLKKGRLELQEVKKKFQKPEDPWGDDTVKTNTNRNPNETIFGDNKNKKEKKYGPKPETPKNVPPETNNNEPLTKHQKERQKIETKRKEYNLKPDSRGVYKPTKPGLKKSLEKQITYSSTPPKPSAKKTPEAIIKFNQQVRKSEKYSGNENQKRVKKLVDRAYKKQKIDKSKAGLVQRMKDIAYGKNPYKKVFGSTGLNMQKKYDKQMIEFGGKLNKLQTPKQLEKLKAKIASKPVEKTMTYLAPAGSGKPVPLKIPRKKKIIVPPVTNPLKTSTQTAYNPYKATKTTSRFGRVLTALKKNPKTALAAAAIGTGVYLYNQGKKNPKGIIPPPVSKGKIKGAKGVDIKFTLGGGDPSRGFKYAGRTNTNK